MKLMEAKYATLLMGAQQMIDKLEKRNDFLEREIVRMGKAFRQQGGDSVDRTDLSSRSGE
jgi:hypothetical protein